MADDKRPKNVLETGTSMSETMEPFNRDLFKFANPDQAAREDAGKYSNHFINDKNRITLQDLIAISEGVGRANAESEKLNLAPQQEGRDAQLKLLQLLESQRGQDTVAKMQGQKALGKSAYATAQKQAAGGGLAQATEDTRNEQDVVSQVGEGALSQDMATRNMQNLLSTQGRGQDLQITKAQNQLDVANQQSRNAMINFYMALGDSYQMAEARTKLENERLKLDLTSRYRAETDATVKAAAQVIGTMMGGQQGGAIGQAAGSLFTKKGR